MLAMLGGDVDVERAPGPCTAVTGRSGATQSTSSWVT